MKFLGKLEKSKSFWQLLTIICGFFLLRFPSLFEPYWYGDEGVYQAVGLAIRNGRLLYKGVWENKPPLLYIIYSLFDSDQFMVRLASMIFGILAIIVFFKLAKKIFQSDRISLYITGFFALFFGMPLLEGNIANAENFMALPILISALILFSIKEGEKNRESRNIFLAFTSGIILGIAFLFKIVAMFDFAAFLIFMAFFADEKFLYHIKNRKYMTYEVKKVFMFGAGFAIFPLLTAMFFLIKGAFPEFLTATFLSNIGYVGYGNKFIIPQGLLLVKLSLLFGTVIILFIKRKLFSKTFVFVWIWFIFSLFNAFFSQRPYTHYLLVLLPSFSILLGLIFLDKKFRKFSIALFVIALILISKNFGVYGKPISYYGNFISFVKGEKSTQQYQRFFDSMTPVDYELTSFINTNTEKNDNIYTWGNNAQLYKLTNKLPPGRFTVAYHVTGSKGGIEETAKAIEAKKVKFIIRMPYMNFFPFDLSRYSQRMMIDNATIYERVL